MRKYSLYISIAMFVLAAICGIAEATFYGGIDENDVLQESLFLPLTFIFAAGGLVFWVLFALQLLFNSKSNQDS